MRTILYPRWIIDGTGAPPLKDYTVVISDGVIEAVEPAGAVVVRVGDETSDLGDTTLIPGLINSHVHLVLPGTNSPFPNIQFESDVSLAVRAVHNVQVCLRSGVTTVRDCGGRGTSVLEVRDAQASGLIEGARVISCGWPITITGGHCRYFGGEADSKEELRLMVRRLISEGADFVKVMASGGGTPGSLPQDPSFSVSELQTIVDTAHSLGRKVAAHCIATASIENAVNAGVDLIEHASFMAADGRYEFDARVAEKVATAGIPVTATLQVFRDCANLSPDKPERMRWALRHDAQRKIMRELHIRGVRLLAGSDAGWRLTTYDTFWATLDELVGIGLSPVGAINAATGAVAEALGYGDRYGTIRVGLTADLVAVGGELARDIRRMTDIKAVFQRGKVVYLSAANSALND